MSSAGSTWAWYASFYLDFTVFCWLENWVGYPQITWNSKLIVILENQAVWNHERQPKKRRVAVSVFSNLCWLKNDLEMKFQVVTFDYWLVTLNPCNIRTSRVVQMDANPQLYPLHPCTTGLRYSGAWCWLGWTLLQCIHLSSILAANKELLGNSDLKKALNKKQV